VRTALTTIVGVTTAVAEPAEQAGVGAPERTPLPGEGRVRGRMATALFIAWRNLTGERRRWLLSAGALGIAAMLVLFLEGTGRWITTSSTAFLDHSDAQVVVAERGIEDLLFAQSAFPQAALTQVQQVHGVRSIDPIVGVNGVVPVNGTHLPVFLVGFDPDHGGGPWHVTDGSGRPHGDEVVLDRGFASIAGVHVGDTMPLFGHTVRVVGLSTDTNAAGDFFLFSSLDFAQQVGGSGLVSYGLVHVAPETAVSAVVDAVNHVDGVAAFPMETVKANDREMITTSFAQPVQIIVLVGLIAGVLIAGIVLYTATVEHARDYAVLKAVGAEGGILYGSALLQSAVLSVVGFAVGALLAVALALGFDRWHPVIESQIDAGLVLEVGGLVLAVNLLATVLPIRHVRRIDPQEVFKA
jgi:putative ABC transport system permease protein